MLLKATIKNFQSQKRTVIDFHKGINVFTGMSDKGKTVIIRAIRWVVFNKPSGDDFRSYWGGDTSVELEFSDGLIITRVKTNTDNYYMLNGEKLKAFGQGVPDKVTEALNLDEVNIQQQMDAPFLLSETAGEVAIHFNKIAGISIINISIARAKKEVADTKQSITQREEDLQEKKEQLEAYKDIGTLEKAVARLEKKDKRRKEVGISAFWLKDKVKRLKEIDDNFKEIEGLLRLEKPIKEILLKKEQVDVKKKEIKRLNALVSNLQEVEEQYVETIAAIKHEPAINKLLEKHSKKSLIQRDLAALRTLVGKYNTLTVKWQENNENLAKLIATMPEVCPVCKGTGKLK